MLNCIVELANHIEIRAREHAKFITDEEIRLRKPVASDENLSLREILHRGQSHTITDPREYQLELFERAKKQNVIAVLDTGIRP